MAKNSELFDILLYIVLQYQSRFLYFNLTINRKGVKKYGYLTKRRRRAPPLIQKRYCCHLFKSVSLACSANRAEARFFVFYLANSVVLVSRITITLISPGYLRSFSIFRAILRANSFDSTSPSSSGRTKMRISRPACRA